ncbi:MAG: DUF3086 domain-containing protein [Cyanobacteria bacterium P01_F01_bin.143]
MNSEIPPIPESEPIQELASLESSDVADNSDETVAKAQFTSESPDIWEDDEENIIDSSVIEEITDIPEVAVEPINNESSVIDSEPSLEVNLESSQPEPTEPELIAEPVLPTQEKTELFTDTWLDESENTAQSSATEEKTGELTSQIADLQQQKATLIEEIRLLEIRKEEAMSLQVKDLQKTLGQMVEEGMAELRERKNNILIDIEKLERRRERINQEMRTNFAGVSQDLAVRTQGFKEYLVGSLQDLVTAAEQLELGRKEPPAPSREVRDNRAVRDPRDRESRTSRDRDTRGSRDRRSPSQSSRRGSRDSQPQFTEQAFAEQERKIRQILEQYRTSPDYYGPPWQLRRTFEPIHEERVKDWFFVKGGRGAIKGVGSRLQNILVTAAVISVLHRLYRDRCRILVLVDTPEKLGEWRRGLQDCLGISRGDFGSSLGVVLFESADVLVQRAERLLQEKLLPFIIIDETEELVNLTLLKFPLWLAFTAESQSKTTGYLY